MSATPVFVSRRTFVGGLVIALTLPACSSKRKGSGELKVIEPNAWLRIGTDDSITLLCDRAEMGQGVYTSLPMLIAEELGVGLRKVKVEFAPPGDQYHNNLLGGQITGGSTSVRDGWEKLRARRRHGASPAGERRCIGMGRRCAHLPRGRRRHRFAAVQEAQVRRSCRGGGQTTGAEGRAAQVARGFHADRPCAETPRHAREGGRQRDLRHRRAAEGHVVRRAGATAGAGRFGQDLQRREGALHARREGRGTHLLRRRRGRRFLVARAARRATSSRSSGTRAPTARSTTRRSRKPCAKARRAKGAWHATTATRPRPSGAPRACTAPSTSCRCSRTPRSSRRTARPTCATTASTSTYPRRFSRSPRPRRPGRPAWTRPRCACTPRFSAAASGAGSKWISSPRPSRPRRR